jgi:hypothetical protein
VPKQGVKAGSNHKTHLVYDQFKLYVLISQVLGDHSRASIAPDLCR